MAGAVYNPDEAVDAVQALELYTSRAAACMDLPGLGRIEPGYEASFVVLDRDVFTVPTADISRVAVSQTWIRGTCAHTA